MYVDIVFMQGDEGCEVVDRLCRVEGVVAHGATDATIADAIEYLSQWDYGDDDNVRADLGAGSRDEIVERDGYVLTWNLGLGYVGLSRRVED